MAAHCFQVCLNLLHEWRRTCLQCLRIIYNCNVDMVFFNRLSTKVASFHNLKFKLKVNKIYHNYCFIIRSPYSLHGRRSKGKGKGIRAWDHARGRREEGVSLPPSSRAPRVSLAPKTPFPKTPFPFPFKRLPRRLVSLVVIILNKEFGHHG